MGRNLDTSLHRWANGARTAIALAGGGLAMALLCARGRPRSGPGLVGLVLVVLVGHFAESALVGTLLPRLLR